MGFGSINSWPHGKHETDMSIPTQSLTAMDSQGDPAIDAEATLGDYCAAYDGYLGRQYPNEETRRIALGPVLKVQNALAVLAVTAEVVQQAELTVFLAHQQTK